MAKGNIALGKFRGKVGGQVLRVDAGIGQIISEYNPNPKNPRTVAQTNQRNKMSLAGQISKITPYDAIAGLSVNRRNARSMFVSNIIKNATIPSPSGTTHEANILGNALIFSKGENVALTKSVSYDDTTRKLTIALTNNEAMQDIVGYRVVVFMTGDMEWKYCVVADKTANEVGTPTSIVIDVPSDVAGDSSNFAKAYVVPIVAKNADARTQYQLFLADAETTGSKMSVNVIRTIAANEGFAQSQDLTPVALG